MVLNTAGMDPSLLGEPDGLNVLFDQLCCARVQLHEVDRVGTTADRLYTDRAGPCEQIEHPCIHHFIPEHIKKRPSGLVHHRARSLPGGSFEMSAFGSAGDHTKHRTIVMGDKP